jgi:hypothetical protein
MLFYTYMHRRADDLKPFYIGKGKGGRARSKANRNPHWLRTASKHGLVVEVIANWPTEREAFEHERFLIKCFRDIGYKLVNMSDGGEGQSGWVPSKETRQKISASTTGRRLSPEASAAQAAKLRGRKQTPEQIEAARLGRIRAGSKADKPVLCVESGQVFRSIGEAVRWLQESGFAKADKAAVSRVCRGAPKCKTAYGHTWKFINRKE